MIVITGATGQLGSLVVKHLLPLVPASQIRLAVRDPSKVAPEVTAQGVAVGEGDYASPAFAETLAGCSKLLLVSAPKFGDECIALHRQAIDAAKHAGVGCVYYTSHVGGLPGSLLKDHAVTHGLLEQSGVKHVVLRNGFYADNLVKFGQAGDIRVPADGKVSWTTRDDLAKATAALLARDPPAAQSSHVFLTNSAAVDFDDVAKIWTDKLGRPTTRTVVDDGEFIETLKGMGIPEAYAHFYVAMFAASAKGDYSKVDPTLEELIGGKATSIEDILKGGLA